MKKFIVKKRARKEYEQITCINQCLRYAINNIQFDENSNIIENVDEIELD